MELILYPKDIAQQVNMSIEELSIEHFTIFDKVSDWSFDRITYKCPKGFVKYLNHEDKSLIGKIGFENLSDESLDCDGEHYYLPTRIPFSDAIYNEYGMISDRQVVTNFVEKKSISYEEFKKEKNRLLEIRNNDLPAKLEKALSEIRPKFIEEMDASKYDGKSESSTVCNFKNGILKLAFKKTVDFLKSECPGFNIEEYMIFHKKASEFREIHQRNIAKIQEEIAQLFYD
jgi:hypothetical protein